jgi:hypothetical protein
MINLYGRLIETGRDAINKFKEGLSKLNPIEWGKDLISNFIQGIKDKIGDLKSACENIAQTVKEYIGFFATTVDAKIEQLYP